LCLSSSSTLHFFSSIALLTGVSLHMQWPLTSQSHGSFLKVKIFFFCDQTPLLIRLGISPPSFEIVVRNVWVWTKPLITEEICPCQGLNPGLPNDTGPLHIHYSTSSCSAHTF
jgi:hypothetical protein